MVGPPIECLAKRLPGPLIRRCANLVRRSGSFSLAIRASIIAWPDWPMISEMTESSLMLVSSSVFCRRWTWLVCSRTSCSRVRCSARQFLGFLVRYKAAADQSAGQQIGDPHLRQYDGLDDAISAVGAEIATVIARIASRRCRPSFSRDVLDVPRLRRSAGLHRHMAAARLGQPRQQGSQTRRSRREGPALALDLAPTMTRTHRTTDSSCTSMPAPRS
jgi:hypothetical protein